MTKDEAIQKLLYAAAGEIGYSEKAGKENKYAEYLTKLKTYYNGAKWSPGWGCDWCEIFVDYMFAKTFGNTIGRQMVYQPEKSLGAGCTHSANYYIKNKAWTTNPSKGYQGYLGKRGNEYHTGIVESFTATTVTMIEGNVTDSSNPKAPTKVRRVTRPRSEFSGFGIPNYALVVNETPTPEKPNVEKRIDAEVTKLSVMAKNVLKGKYGNGATRKKNLGEYYDPVQFIINKSL